MGAENLLVVVRVPWELGGKARLGSPIHEEAYEKLRNESSIANRGRLNFDVSQNELAGFDGGAPSGGPPGSRPRSTTGGASSGRDP